MSARRRTILAFALVTLAMTTAAAPTVDPPPTPEEPVWAPVDEATIRPGIEMVTKGQGCTANFVFVTNDLDTGAVQSIMLGYAGHCATTARGSDRCHSTTLPLGTPVRVQGATHVGTVAYIATTAMRAAGEDDAVTCRENDFALVALHPDDWRSVNPTVPHFGGPAGVADDPLTFGAPTYSYVGDGPPLDLVDFGPREGTALGTESDGWKHSFYQVFPGAPGSSGSGILDGQGRAIGVLSSLTLAPAAGSNNATDVGRAIAYAREHVPALASLRLADGTEPFSR